MGLHSLQHLQDVRVHITRVLPARYVPPSGFGYPLDGFLPWRPRRLCFTPAALVGFALRSVLLPKGIRAFRPGCTHIPFSPSVNPMPKHQAGPPSRGFWALTLPGVPRGPRGISARPAGCSHGLFPLWAFPRRPCPGFRPVSSHALCGECGKPLRRRRPRVSIGPRLTASPPRDLHRGRHAATP
jgi:hypothetical protein